MNEARGVLTAMSLMGELISAQFQLGFKANKDVGPITEVAVLKVKETNEIRDLSRAIFEIPENRAKSNRKRRNKLKTGGEIWGKFKKRIARTISIN